MMPLIHMPMEPIKPDKEIKGWHMEEVIGMAVSNSRAIIWEVGTVDARRRTMCCAAPAINGVYPLVTCEECKKEIDIQKYGTRLMGGGERDKWSHLFEIMAL